MSLGITETPFRKMAYMDTVSFIQTDGGRQAAGFVGDAGDCVTRAIALATGRSYIAVYDDLSARMAAKGKPRSARNGIDKAVTRSYLDDNGWVWVPTMGIGTGCTVHLRGDELPPRRIIAQCSRHVVAVIDGVVHDSHDSTRDGTRCVYGYWWDAHDEDAVAFHFGRQP